MAADHLPLGSGLGTFQAGFEAYRTPDNGGGDGETDTRENGARSNPFSGPGKMTLATFRSAPCTSNTTTWPCRTCG